MNTWLAFAHCWVVCRDRYIDVSLFYLHTDGLAGLVKKLSFVFMKAKGHSTTCPYWLSGWWGGWALPLTRAVCASSGERIVELLLGEELHLVANAWKNVFLCSLIWTNSFLCFLLRVFKGGHSSWLHLYVYWWTTNKYWFWREKLQESSKVIWFVRNGPDQTKVKPFSGCTVFEALAA